MELFFSMVYTLLKLKYNIINLSRNSADIKVTRPSLYKGRIEDGTIYIVENSADFIFPENESNCVFLFYETDAIGLTFSPDSHAFLVGSCHDSNELLNCVIDAILRLGQWNSRCIEYVYDNSNPSILLNHFYTLCPNRIIFEDDSFKHIYELPKYTTPPSDSKIKYASESSASPQNPELPSFDQFTATINSEVIYEISELEKTHVLYISASDSYIIASSLTDYSGKKLGRICVKYNHSDLNDKVLLTGFCRLVDIFSAHFETKINNSLIGAMDSNDSLHSSILNLISAPKGSGNLRAYLKFLPSINWSMNDKYIMITIHISTKSLYAEVSGYFRSFVESLWNNCVAVCRDNNIIIIFNNTLAPDRSPDQIVETLSLLREGNEKMISSVTVSNFFYNITFAPFFYEQCQYLIQVTNGNDDSQWLYYFSDYISNYLAEYINSNYPLSFLCHPGVFEVFDYDRNNNSELMWTLYNYVKYHQNTSLASDAISVHRTTFIKRLEKINSIYDFDYESSDEILNILFSIKLLNFYKFE